MNSEVIDGSTRLENELASIHPRLYFTDRDWPAIVKRFRSRPMKPWSRVFLAQADQSLKLLPARGRLIPTGGDTRRRGCDMATHAMAFRLTGQARYRAAALRLAYGDLHG